MRHSVLLSGALLAVIPLWSAEIEFNRDVRPILSDKCLLCHGTDATSRKVPLRLDREDSAKAVLGDGRRALVEGHPEQSEVVKRITATSAAVRMPPAYSGLKLSPSEIETLRSWVEQGAKWQKHWSFVPPHVPDPPAGSNPIDYFVQARLDREALKRSPEADRVTLIRRVSFDLTGLPPTPHEVDAFVHDASPTAYEKVVDRLLASSRYGERMAARWLDAARYADTNGYQTDAERVMWRWRDWVIDAFNTNKPFDKFALEQIAGDLLPGATLDQKIATGFNRNHRGNSEGGIVPEEYLVEYAVDRVETTSTVFLGVTLGCARCHNHKYDPFTQREFYQMLAYFNNVPELGRYLKYGNTPPVVSAPTRQQQLRISQLEAGVKDAEKHFDSRARNIADGQTAWERSLVNSADWHISDELDSAIPEDHRVAQKDGKELGDHGDFGYLDRFTVEAVVKPESADGALISRSEEKDDGEGWSIVLEQGKLQVNLIKRKLDDSIRVETERPISLNTPHHIAFSYDGSRMAVGVRIYIDGKPETGRIILDAINQDFRTKQPLRIGGHAESTASFSGSIGKVRLYREVLTPEEISIEAAQRTLHEIAGIPEGSRTAGESAKIRRAFLETGAEADLRGIWTSLRRARLALETYLRTVPTVMVMAESPVRKETFVLDRGVYDRPKDKVTRGVPAALHALPAQAPDNRLGLAMWIIDPANPLTARVAVNRFWQMYFGTGIVKTTEDFGSQGEWPVNPELMDWLAANFVRSGWDMKALQKLIVMSSTYRQSSRVSADLLARDPENRLLARGPRLRLPAEMVRDQALTASGLLVEKIGGPSVKPYQPAGLWAELGDKDYERDHGEDLYRRSLYTYWKRTSAPPFMSTFDSALRESCVVRESRTNTPLQALDLMNDVTFVESARVLAQNAIASSREPEARLVFEFRQVLSRSPKPAELERLKHSLAYYSDRYQSQPGEAEKLAGVGDAPRLKNMGAPEIAAYTAVGSLLFNLDEAITKE